MLLRIRKNQPSQKGIVTIGIVIILMIIVSIIILAITEVNSAGSSKYQDNQESIQASYAAEAGINDAISAIKHQGSLQPTSGCNGAGSFMHLYNLNNVLNTSPSIAYTCLLVTSSPSSLLVNVKATMSSQLRIETDPSTNKLKISWPATPNDTNNLSNCNQTSLEFVPEYSWNCPYSVLRMDYFQNNPNTTDTTTQELAKDTDTFFFFPVASGGEDPAHIMLDNSDKPTIIPVNCADPATGNGCTITLQSDNGVFNGYARLTSIYGDAGNVTISSLSSVFDNGQLSIDSTGDDQGVLKRLQVRIQLSSGASVAAPDAAVSAGQALCKQYRVGPNNEGGIASPYPNTNQPAGNLDPGANDTAPLCGLAYKPVIYLYPTHSELVNVKLHYPSGFAATIPQYNPSSGWNVLANPSGQLTNTADGKVYPYLYWEGNKTQFDFDMSKGFVVPGSQTAAFLSQELPKIGLNKTETAAFIQYWAPRMEHNPYSLIHFAGKDYTNMAKLNITPKPDSLLRVFMAEEPLSQPIPVTPQIFPIFHRTGFTAVEWGGTIL